MAGKRLEIIQFLRGIAALLVVLLHFQPILRSEWPALAGAMGHGHIGVDIFFILSGIVIYVSTEDSRNRSAHRFLIRRFFRVVAPAWAAMLLLAVIQPPFLKALLLSVLFIPLQNGHPPSYGYSFLIVAWTLTYELIFYLIFAGALSFKFGREHRGWVAGSMVLATVISVQMLAGVYTLDAESAGLLPEHKYFPVQIISLLGNPLFLEFVIGLGLAYLYQRGAFTWIGRYRYGLLGLGGAACILILAFQYRDGNGLTNSGLLATVIVVCALAMQSLIDTGSRTYQRRFGLMLAQRLGDISYSLYLVHPIVRTGLLSLPVFAPITEQLYPIPKFLLLLLLTFIISALFYRLIEIPSQQLGKWFADLSMRSWIGSGPCQSSSLGAAAPRASTKRRRGPDQ